MPHQTVAQKLHEELGKLIAHTEPGERLPSEPKLASSLGVSRATLREAMRWYEAQGMIHRRQGSGTFVTHPSGVIESGLEVLESIGTMAERIDLPVKMEEWRVELRPAEKKEADALNLDAGKKVYHISRVILAEDRPVAYLIDILPEGIISAEELEKQPSGSILDLLLERGAPALLTSRTEINAVTASPEVARSLGIQRGDVLLHFTAFLYATDGRVVDYSFSYFLPGYFRFHVVRRVGSA